MGRQNFWRGYENAKMKYHAGVFQHISICCILNIWVQIEILG
uniref:Uncharacterized protein n=1 Tax=Rhizophora mucronata TaxID=61149 RepID=A0A2P2NM71_RHIMU